MKKLFSLKQALLLVAVVLFGITSLNAQTVIKVGSAADSIAGTADVTLIKFAYNKIPADITILGAYVIELEGSYDPTKEAYPITLGAKTGASATNYISIKPATGVKKTIGPSNQTVIATVTGSTFTTNAAATENIDLTGLITKGDISYLSPPSTSINVTTTISTTATITSGTLVSGVTYTISGNANIPDNTTFTYSGSNTITLSAAATAAGTGVATTVKQCVYVAGIGTYIAAAFKQVTTVTGNVLTIQTGSFTAGSIAGNKLFLGPAQTCAIKFNGATYVTIDGVSRTDVNTGLTIQNPNCIYAQTILLANSSQYNTVKNCIIRGANQTGAWNNGYQGTIFFGGTGAGTNSNNTIANNDICDMNDVNTPYPICAFQMTAAGGSNNNNTVMNNNVYNISNLYSGNGTFDFMQFGSESSSANNVVANNRFYWTAPTTVTGNIIPINVGTLSTGNRFYGNTIGYGASDGTGTSTLTSTGTFGTGNGIRNMTCKNNTVGGINFTGTGFRGLYIYGAANTYAADSTCNGNTVKDITFTPTASAQLLEGIYITSSNAANMNCENNIVKNITIASSTAGYACTAYGIRAAGTAANNYNYSSNQVSGVLAGNSGSTAANVAYGIVTQANAMTIDRNLVYNISALNNTTTGIVYGIQTNGGNAQTQTYNSISSTGTLIKNNIVRLGIDVSNDALIYGIYQGTLTAATNAFATYHNTVYVGGTAPASATKNTFDFYTAQATAISGTGKNEVKNNIFANQRGFVAGGTPTAVNYAVAIPTATTSVVSASDYNLYFATVIGLLNSTSKTALADWQGAVGTGSDAGSVSADPLFVNPTATTPDMHLPSNSRANQVPNAAIATVTDDFAGMNRVDYTPNDLGALVISGSTGVQTQKQANELNENIYAANNSIVFNNLSGSNARIYSLGGQLLKSVLISSDKTEVPSEKGFYIVNTGNINAKVLVK